MRHLTRVIVIGTTATAFALCCAGVHEQIVRLDAAIAVIDDAALAVDFAAEHAAVAAELVFRAELARRFDEANALTTSVANAVLAVRAAVPTTRDAIPAEVEEARTYIEAARQHLAQRGSEPSWSCAPQASCVGLATALLDEATELLDECSEGRVDEADVTYERVFELYQAWRDSTESLAASAAADPVGTWIEPVDDNDDER